MKHLKSNLVMIFIAISIGLPLSIVIFWKNLNFIIDPVYEIVFPNQIREHWIIIEEKTIDNRNYAAFTSEVDAKYISIVVEMYDSNNYVIDKIFLQQFNVTANREYLLEIDFQNTEILNTHHYTIKYYSGKRA